MRLSRSLLYLFIYLSLLLRVIVRQCQAGSFRFVPVRSGSFRFRSCWIDSVVAEPCRTEPEFFDRRVIVTGAQWRNSIRVSRPYRRLMAEFAERRGEERRCADSRYGNVSKNKHN